MVRMTVLTSGYWAPTQTYARPGDVIEVDEVLVEILELAGFAERQKAAPAAKPSTRATRHPA